MGIYNPKTDAYVWLSVNSTPEFLPGEKSPFRAYAVFRNITDQKNAEEMLAKSEKQNRLLIDEMLSGIALHEIICDKKGKPIDYRFLSVNTAFEKMTGLDAVNIVGKTVLEVLPGIESSWIERYGKVALTGEPIQFENYTAALGKHYEVRAYSPEHGKFATLINEITERKLAEEKLIQANKRLSLAQRSSRAGVWDWDIVTGKLEWSPELFELFGLDAATIPTFEVWRNVMYPDDVQAAGDRIDQAIREHKPLTNEYRIVLPSGEVLWINALGDTIYNDQGEPLRMSGICIDITERKKVEQRIQRQLEHLNSLSAIDRVITTNFDLNVSLSEILTHVTKELEVDAADILLLDPISDMLEYAARCRFYFEISEKNPFTTGGKPCRPGSTGTQTYPYSKFKN